MGYFRIVGILRPVDKAEAATAVQDVVGIAATSSWVSSALQTLSIALASASWIGLRLFSLYGIKSTESLPTPHDSDFDVTQGVGNCYNLSMTVGGNGKNLEGQE